MKIASLCTIAALALLGCTSRPSAPPPPQPGWVDFARVRAESALGKRLGEDDQVFRGSRQQELDKISQALADSEKAKDGDLDSKRSAAKQKLQQFNADVQKHDAEDVQRLRDEMRPVLARLTVGRNLDTVSMAPPDRLWSANDLTDAVIAELDSASNAKAVADELRRTQAALAEATKAKPSEPSRKP